MGLYDKPGVGAFLDALGTGFAQANPLSKQIPIFVLGAGWFSGNLVIQRMLSRNCYMWGEPYSLGWPIDSLLDQFRAVADLTASRVVDVGDFALGGVYPSLDDLIAAHYALFAELFVSPAVRSGAMRWGISDTRLTGEHARYLKWLFPRAKFVFLHRNPYESFEEYFRLGQTWLVRPKHALTVSSFGRHWKELTSSFFQVAEHVDGYVLSYEKLLSGERHAELERYLEVPLLKIPAAVSAGAAMGGNGAVAMPEESIASASAVGAEKNRRRVPLSHWLALHKEVATEANKRGYSWTPPQLSQAQPNQTAVPADENSGPNASARLSRVANRESRARCAVIVRVRGHIEKLCEEGLRGLEDLGYVVKRVHGFSAVDVGRNMNAGLALAEGFSEIMWIDSRTAFHPSAVDTLRSSGLPIIGAVVPKLSSPGFECNFPPGTDKVVFGKGGGVLEVEHTSCLFLLTHSSVFANLQLSQDLPLCNQSMANGLGMVPYFKPFYEQKGGVTRYLSDDYAFIERARECGFKIYVDTSLRVGHIVSYPLTWENVGKPPEHFETYELRYSS